MVGLVRTDQWPALTSGLSCSQVLQSPLGMRSVANPRERRMARAEATGATMQRDHWLAFVAASAVLLAIPGPTVLLVTSYARGHGGKPAAAIVAGVALGDLTQ